jgi:D-methionine transport system substrate-binding protein
MRRIALALTAAALAVGVVACGDEEQTASSSSTDTSKPLVVGASPVPHAEILNFIKDNLAEKAGLKLEVKEFTDYVLPNTALIDGQLDANYFQTPAYLADQEKARNFKAQSIVGVHIEPLGLYSKKITDISAIPDGAQIAIPNDPTNEARALRLLAANKLITLDDNASTTATIRNITDNPKNIEFAEVEAAQTPRSLDDADLAVINGNYAIEADLTPSEDALVLEQAEGNPNANLLVTLPGEANDPRVKKLAELLTSPEVKQFIDENYKGAVLAAF